MKIDGKEVSKFLAGVAFAGSIANAYLARKGIAVPFLTYRISPSFLGVRAVMQFVLFLAFFYYGFVRRPEEGGSP
ncbi:MAG: hypothetical protein JOZ24_07720 [Candidatus Eremiobacteraeota bacterium]|nr:hypothetical protein [Candidatus Eremiobacteraeota bacterium]